jgi:hypothetical protein
MVYRPDPSHHGVNEKREASEQQEDGDGEGNPTPAHSDDPFAINGQIGGIHKDIAVISY